MATLMLLQHLPQQGSSRRPASGSMALQVCARLAAKSLPCTGDLPLCSGLSVLPVPPASLLHPPHLGHPAVPERDGCSTQPGVQLQVQESIPSFTPRTLLFQTKVSRMLLFHTKASSTLPFQTKPSSTLLFQTKPSSTLPFNTKASITLPFQTKPSSTLLFQTKASKIPRGPFREGPTNLPSALCILPAVLLPGQ